MVDTRFGFLLHCHCWLSSRHNSFLTLEKSIFFPLLWGSTQNFWDSRERIMKNDLPTPLLFPNKYKSLFSHWVQWFLTPGVHCNHCCSTFKIFWSWILPQLNEISGRILPKYSFWAGFRNHIRTPIPWAIKIWIRCLTRECWRIRVYIGLPVVPDKNTEERV